MLLDLSIRDFAIIDQLELRFAPGFNVITGETGAGKSILIDAVGLMLGGRADTTFIRTGSERAMVEGTFKLEGLLREDVCAVLARELVIEPDELCDSITLTRELRQTGRNVSRINGVTVSTAVLREVAGLLVDVHGQSDHLSLLDVKQHVNLLDRYADVNKKRVAFAGLVKKLGGIRQALAALQKDERDTQIRMDTLTYQVEEIEAAQLKPGEDETLKDERVRLANAEKLALLADQAIAAATEGVPGADSAPQPAATDLLGEIVSALEDLARIDESMGGKLELAIGLAEQLDELSHDLRDYRDEIEFNSERLNEVEERLGLIQQLKRKYGDSIEDILAHAEDARAELDNITHAEERIEQLQADEAQLLTELGTLGVVLHDDREAAGRQLAAGIERELEDLRMQKARFRVDLDWIDDPHGAILPDGRRVKFDSTGIDRVEFMVETNPGEGFKPLVKVASGGETARLMLSLKGVLAQVDQTPTLIFDEIDTGIGGRVGATVGSKMWRLSRNHQVMCITHLPQLAGYGDVHFKVDKLIHEGRTQTTIYPLEHGRRVDELAQMLGTGMDTARQSAADLLDEVASEKSAAVA